MVSLVTLQCSRRNGAKPLAEETRERDESMTRRSCQGPKAYDGGWSGWEIGTWEATAAAGCKVPRRGGGRAKRDGRLGLGGDGCCTRREGEGVLGLGLRKVYILKPKRRSILVETNLYITIKIKNIYRSYRLTDNKFLIDWLPTDKLIGINFLTDYRSIIISYGYIGSVNIGNR